MDHPTSNVVAIPVIQKYNVFMDSQVESNIQVCYGSNLSNFRNTMYDYLWIITKMDTDTVETHKERGLSQV